MTFLHQPIKIIIVIHTNNNKYNNYKIIQFISLYYYTNKYIIYRKKLNLVQLYVTNNAYCHSLAKVIIFTPTDVHDNNC